MEAAATAARFAENARMTLANVNYLHASVLLQELMDRGARRVVISPGSRSLPLAHVAMEIRELEQFVLMDERSAGFFALGLSRADGIPAILICTSGTAAANYYPAVIEAAQSQAPLIILTADRPLALRNSGAPQTIDQSHLYGRYPKFFVDLPAANASLERCWMIRSIAAHTFAAASDVAAGPVHLNVPFDEPLAPVPQDEATCRDIWNALRQEESESVPVRTSLRFPAREDVDRVYDVVERAMCGLIVCGPNAARTEHQGAAIHYLARQLGWPVFADVASGLRFHGQPVVPYYDVFLRTDEMGVMAPDVVLAFGAYPTSKVLNTYLDRHRDAHTIRVQPHLARQDPTARAADVIIADVGVLCEELAESVSVARDSLLLDPFQRASQAVHVALNEAQENCEALYVHQVTQALPDRANVVLASSLSIRYADALAAAEGQSHPVFAMRGANGIDGTISFASGIAAATKTPTLLVLGDLAFCHDLNGLLAATRYAPELTLLLLNNDGGGIFHFLPAYGMTEHFEAVQGTQHGMALSAAKDMFHLHWDAVPSLGDLQNLMSSRERGVRVLEVKISRSENHRAHVTLFDRLARAAISS
jgi:2-succinyl-5-enolpyruvyl-6-hydroxy-3-cyclohexene-1-carboxylate synthase